VEAEEGEVKDRKWRELLGRFIFEFRNRENVQCANVCYSVSVSSAGRWFSLLLL
jgi:hypothetical protein